MTTKSRLGPPPARSNKIDSPEADAFILGTSVPQTQVQPPAARANSHQSTPSDPVAGPAVRSIIPIELVPATEPWLAPGLDGTKGLLVRIPEREYTMLRHLAHSVYGNSLQSLSLAVLRNFIVEAMTRQGFEVTQDADGSIDVKRAS